MIRRDPVILSNYYYFFYVLDIVTTARTWSNPNGVTAYSCVLVLVFRYVKSRFSSEDTSNMPLLTHLHSATHRVPLSSHSSRSLGPFQSQGYCMDGVSHVSMWVSSGFSMLLAKGGLINCPENDWQPMCSCLMPSLQDNPRIRYSQDESGIKSATLRKERDCFDFHKILQSRWSRSHLLSVGCCFFFFLRSLKAAQPHHRCSPLRTLRIWTPTLRNVASIFLQPRNNIQGAKNSSNFALLTISKMQHTFYAD